MHLPIRFLSHKWPSLIEKRASRFFWNDPAVLLNDNVSPEEFRTAMSAIHVGGTIKITGAKRHPDADSLILDNIDPSDASIVDIGASDGSTSVDLIRRLPAFKSYTMADLYFTISAINDRGRTLFFDEDGSCVLIVGERTLAWPTQSKFVEFLYRPAVRRATRGGSTRRGVLLLNPDARELVATDSRVRFISHDIFEPWTGETPTIIKVANLLRRLYFSDERILIALAVLMQDLDELGYLLIVDNSRIPGMPPRGGLYQKRCGRFVRVATTENIPEIEDLVMRVGISN